MNFFKFLLYSTMIIILYMRLKSGPYIYQSNKKHYIEIKDHKFDTEKLIVKKGDVLIFTNKDQIRHTVKSDNIYKENSPILFQHDTWEITLDDKVKTIIFNSSLYDNMNQLNVEVIDIYKDTSAENKFRQNLLMLKKRGKELSDRYLKKK